MKQKANVVWVALIGLLGICGGTFAQWTEPVPVEEINTENLREWTPYLSFDGLSLYFAQGRGTSAHHLRLYEAKRATCFEPFGDAMEVLRAGDDVYDPWVSPDKLRLYYIVEEGTDFVLRVSERASILDPWPSGTGISELNLLGKIHSVSLTADELIIVFSATDIPGGQGGVDIWMASRTDTGEPFANVTNLSELNTSAGDGGPSISPDGLVIYFASGRNGPSQIFVATRQYLEEPFGVPEHLPVFDYPDTGNTQPAVSSDGTELYFMRWYAVEKTDIWVSYLGQEVAVDIKPGSCPNPLNLAGRGVLPVAILGTEDFDVKAVNLVSIRLAGVPPVRSSYEDVAAPLIDGNECDCNNPGPDGYLDLTLKFDTQSIVEQLMDLEPLAGEEFVLTLTAALYDGTRIEGADCIVIVGNVRRSAGPQE